MNFYDLQSQHQRYKEEINFAIQKVFDSCQFVMGEDVYEFEKELSQYLNCNNVVSCGSGTDALLLALMAIDLKPNEEVITTPFTFISTAEVICMLGAKPVFADIQPHTYNIDPIKIEEKITKKTRAILPVSLFGQTSDLDEINSLANQYGKHFGRKIYVIEDAAQSLGSTYRGKKSGNLSDMGCLSFFPTKPLGCYGDGGAVTVNDNFLAGKIKSLRVHGQTQRYIHKYIGYNCRLDSIQAAILRVKLRYFDDEILKRQQKAENYFKLLSESKVNLPFVHKDRTSVFAQYSLRSQNRTKMIASFKEKNIPVAVYYPKPLHMQECFSHWEYSSGDFPTAEKASEEVMSLPMNAYISNEQQLFIASCIKETLENEMIT